MTDVTVIITCYPFCLSRQVVQSLALILRLYQIDFCFSFNNDSLNISRSTNMYFIRFVQAMRLFWFSTFKDAFRLLLYKQCITFHISSFDIRLSVQISYRLQSFMYKSFLLKCHILLFNLLLKFFTVLHVCSRIYQKYRSTLSTIIQSIIAHSGI